MPMIVQPFAPTRWPSALLLGLVLFFPVMTRSMDEFPAAGQTENDAMLGTSTELPSWLQTPDGYVYRPEDKPNPFRPFIRPVPSTAEGGFQPLVSRRPLTPLEQVDATQLRVAGIMWEHDQPETALAMVEMPDGKGYVLRPGVFVGPNGGVVLAITPEEIIIEEKGLDYVGRPVARNVILRLHTSQDN